MKATETRTTTLLTILVALAWFMFPRVAPATCIDGCTGLDNATTVLGWEANAFSLGDLNTAIGHFVLYGSSGGRNTGVGGSALENNGTGSYNTASGFEALWWNPTGSFNTATGADALYGDPFSGTTGSYNTAAGSNALYSNATGMGNSGTGSYALYSNTTGGFNTAGGLVALFSNTGGFFNTASGVQALLQNTTGNSNTATGVGALKSNTTGATNTAIGYQALVNSNGSANIALGSGAGGNLTTGSNNIDIGNGGVADESSIIRIGGAAQTKTFIKGISGVPVAGPSVLVNAAGQLGVAASSARFKEEIKPMDQASKAILALRPVSFRYKKEIDPQRVPQFGLVAEEVEKVNPDLVIHDQDGKPYTVRYEQINAMLLNEFLKEHKKVERQQSKIEQQQTTIAELKSTVTRQQKGMESLTTQLKEQAAAIQKVSARVEMTRAASGVVINN